MIFFNPNINKLEKNKNIKALFQALNNKNDIISTKSEIALKNIIANIKVIENEKEPIFNKEIITAFKEIISKSGQDGDLFKLKKVIKIDKESKFEKEITAAFKEIITKSDQDGDLVKLIKVVEIDKESKLEKEIISILKQMDCTGIIPVILDSSEYITIGPRIFNYIGIENVLPALQQIISDETQNAHRLATRGLFSAAGGRGMGLDSVLKDAMSDSDKITKILTGMGEVIVEPLINAIEESNKYEGFGLDRAIIDLGETANNSLINILMKSENENIKVTCIRILGETGNIETIHYLGEILTNDKSAMVRANAADALGNIGNEKAIKYLEPSLNDRGSYQYNQYSSFLYVNEAVNYAIKKIRDKS